MKRKAVPSSTYALFAQAIVERKQVLCRYDGYARELCPVILGHSGGQEMALVYQFAGESSSGLPPGGEWKCLRLAKASDVALRDGSWRAGSSHQRPQSCVEDVDLDINPASPYRPRRPAR
jgi:hypothetical protein